MILRLNALFLMICGAGISLAQDLDPVFNIGAGSNNFVEQALPLKNGKVLICGNFTKYNDQPAAYVARLNEDGTLDTSWNSKVDWWVRHMVLQPDGKVIIGGAFNGVEGATTKLIARLNVDGSLDHTFSTGTGFEEKLAPSDPNPPYVFWMALQADGKIVVTGSFARFNGQTAKGIARLNPDGSLDASFNMGSGLDSWGRFVMVQPDQSILLTGWLTSYNGFPCNRMVRIKPDGSPDTSFRPFFGDKTAIYSAALIEDGKMIVSGHSKNERGLFHDKVRMLNPDGSENETFHATTDERTETVLIQPDGKIILSGWFRTVNNKPQANLARLNRDGTLDETFLALSDSYIWNTAFDSKGRLLIAGGFTLIRGTPRTGIARLILESQPPIDPPPIASPTITNPSFSSGNFTATIASSLGKTYRLQFCDDFSEGQWRDVQVLPGSDGELQFQDFSASDSPNRYYRVKVD